MTKDVKDSKKRGSLQRGGGTCLGLDRDYQGATGPEDLSTKPVPMGIGVPPVPC